MSLRNQFVDVAPAPPAARPRPAVTESLRAQIAPAVTQPVTRHVNTADDVTQSIAMPAPSGTPRTSVRSTPEAYRTYYRNLMRKRRAAVKADTVKLASADP